MAGDAALTRLMSLPNTTARLAPAPVSERLRAHKLQHNPNPERERGAQLSYDYIPTGARTGGCRLASWPRPQPFLSISSLFVVAAPAPASVLARSRHPCLRSLRPA